MNARTLIRVCAFGALLVGCASAEPGAGPGLPASTASLWAKLTRTTLAIPQVDYEPAIFNKPDDPYPHIDFERVDRKKVVQKPHDAVVLENDLVRITVLPAMGRIYSFVFKATGHENLWHNDIVNVLPQVGNPLGWWIWMGGIEHTLPVEEHGTTFALPWSWSATEDSPSRKAVRMQVKEPVTLLEEIIEVALVPGHSHDAAEGMVRVFDKDKTRGVDIWTYGFAPKEIPMGSGGPSRGYVEMWGGTTKTYGPERSILAAGASIMWTEWMFPFQGTRGLTYADRDRAVSFTFDSRACTARIGLCPSGAHQEELELLVAPTAAGAGGASRSLHRWSVDVRPDWPFQAEVRLTDLLEAEYSRLRLRLSAVGSDSKLIEPEPICHKNSAEPERSRRIWRKL